MDMNMSFANLVAILYRPQCDNIQLQLNTKSVNSVPFIGIHLKNDIPETVYEFTLTQPF